MKYCITLVLLLSAGFVLAQKTDYRVVFDMTSKDTINQQAVLRQVQGIKAAHPGAQLEVVMYGDGSDLVVTNLSSRPLVVQQLITDHNVKFAVCAMTLKRKNIDKNQLIKGVEIVDDGIYEIIKRQGEGWGYIKVGH